VPVLFDGHNLSTLVEIELTDLPKPGGAIRAPPWTAPLSIEPNQLLSYYVACSSPYLILIA